MPRKPKKPRITEDGILAAVAMTRRCTGLQPVVGIVLGSGLDAAARAIEGPVEIPRESLPGMPCATVSGHSGRLVLGRVGGVAAAVFCGRTHLYEGFGLDATLAQTRFFDAMGVTSVLLTNAAGGLAPGMKAGDWMLIEDHMDMTFARFSVSRLPVLKNTPVYDAELTKKLEKSFESAGIAVRRGVYAGLTGPNFETPAEVAALRTMGADAVGMSTVHEAVEGWRLGLRVTGLACIVNAAASGDTVLTHEETLKMGARAADGLAGVLPKFVDGVSNAGSSDSKADSE